MHNQEELHHFQSCAHVTHIGMPDRKWMSKWVSYPGSY